MDSLLLNRRRFLLRTAQLSAGVAVLPLAGGALANSSTNMNKWLQQPFSILQGVTTESETQITIDVPEDMPLSCKLFDPINLVSHEAHVARVTSLASLPWAVHFYKFVGLLPEHNYLLQVFDQEMNLVDERELKTINLSKREPKIGFVSCANDIFDNFSVWSTLIANDPDLIIFMGDNVYGDLGVIPGPTNLMRRYIEARSRLHFYRSRKLVPVVAIWDDHDYGKNNSDGDYKHKESSLSIFKTFFPRDPVAGTYAHGPGVASCLRAFGLQFLLLDDRYFRSNAESDSRMLFGNEQTNWAFEQIQNFNGATWIIQGNQTFGAYNHRESFEGVFQKDFYNFMERLRATQKIAFFAGGDVHHSETMTIESHVLGYETFELTASGIHSSTSSLIRANKRRRKSTTKRNFVLVSPHIGDDGMQFDIKSIDKDANVLFSDQIEIES